MQYYKNINVHIELLMQQLANAVGLKTIQDVTQINLDKGKQVFAYVIGDVDPNGINELGQQSQIIELEIRVIIPQSKPDAQLYALGVSTKIVDSLLNDYHGLDDQRLKPVIESNAAIPLSNNDNYDKTQSYVVRSIIFTQVVYLGDPNIATYAIEFTGVESYPLPIGE